MKKILISETQLKKLTMEEQKDTIDILVACEESQAITKEFRARGFNAFSCDLYACTGGHPEWHIKGDCLPLIKGDNHDFTTTDGKSHFVKHWNLIVAHPPCTYLTVTGNRWFNVEKYGDKARERERLRQEAAEFFMKFTKADADHIAIENPIGYMSTHYRKPDQIIQPWMWGDKDVKSTCLWNKNLPKLVPDVKKKPNDIEYKEWVNKDGVKKRQSLNYYNAFAIRNGEERSTVRSKTYPGIAKAIAKQWGDVLEREWKERNGQK